MRSVKRGVNSFQVIQNKESNVATANVKCNAVLFEISKLKRKEYPGPPQA